MARDPFAAPVNTASLFAQVPGLLPSAENTGIEIDTVSNAAVEVALNIMFPKGSHWDGDMLSYCREKLKLHLWSMQRRIFESVQTYKWTLVPSCHGAGKSMTAAVMVPAWIGTHPMGTARVVTSAPTSAQVVQVLWEEVRKQHAKAGLPGKISLGSVPEWRVDRFQVAFGRKPADKVDIEEAMTNFQGVHAQFLLAVLDEANGIPGWLWTAIDSLITAKENRGLAIGNPDSATSEFARRCRNPGEDTNVIPISAFDLPAFTGEQVPQVVLDALTSVEWVTAAAKNWGKESPLYKSKVLGQFPTVGEDTLISPDLLEKCINTDRSAMARAEDRPRYGCDIADQGKDRTVIYENRAGRIRRPTHGGDSYRWQGQTPRKTAAKIFKLLKLSEYRGTPVVDSIGLGMEVVTRLQDVSIPVKGFDARRKAKSRHYYNARSEQWWLLRQAMERGEIDIDPFDYELHAQLTAIKWETHAQSGKIKVETKEETKKRLRVSKMFDDADAFMMSTFEYDHLAPYSARPKEYPHGRPVDSSLPFAEELPGPDPVMGDVNSNILDEMF